MHHRYRLRPRRATRSTRRCATRLELWYQPKIDIKQRCLAGAEAFARIRDPEKGVLLPATFLPGVNDDVMARLTEHALITVLRN